MNAKMESKLLKEIRVIYAENLGYIRKCKLKQVLYLCCSIGAAFTGIWLAENTSYKVTGFVSVFFGGWLMMLGFIYGSAVKSSPLIAKYSTLDKPSIDQRIEELKK